MECVALPKNIGIILRRVFDLERTIFSDNSMTVTVSDNSNKKKSAVKKTQSKNSISINVEDAVKMLAGYQISQHNISPLNEDSGKCVICGSNTNSEMRNICFSCHGQHIKNIYELTEQAIKKGESSFIYKW